MEKRLLEAGLDGPPGSVTSAMAAASLIEPGERVHVCGGPGVVEAVLDRGAEVVEGDARADAVIVGYQPEFDYGLLDLASRHVRGGARLIATNDDPVLPTPAGLRPGTGSLLAAVMRASGTRAVVAGKPHGPMVDLIREILADDEVEVVVGDRLATDGRLAEALGAAFELVVSGATGPEEAGVVSSTNLAEVVERRLGA